MSTQFQKRTQKNHQKSDFELLLYTSYGVFPIAKSSIPFAGIGNERRRRQNGSNTSVEEVNKDRLKKTQAIEIKT